MSHDQTFLVSGQQVSAMASQLKPKPEQEPRPSFLYDIGRYALILAGAFMLFEGLDYLVVSRSMASSRSNGASRRASSSASKMLAVGAGAATSRTGGRSPGQFSGVEIESA